MKPESDKLCDHVAIGYPAGTDAAQPDNTAFVPSENEMSIVLLKAENERLKGERLYLVIMAWTLGFAAAAGWFILLLILVS